MMTGAAARFRRLMMLLPRAASVSRLSLATLAMELDCSQQEIIEDLQALTDRFDEPGDEPDAIGVLIEGNNVAVRTNHFLRPMRVTAAELCALEVGLAVLEQHADAHEAEVIAALRRKLTRCITNLPQDHLHAGVRAGAPAGAGIHRGVVSQLRTALRRRVIVTLEYQGPRDALPTARRVQPQGLLLHHGSWYLSAWCERANGPRLFRCDRVVSVAVTDERIERSEEFDPLTVLHEGRPLNPQVSSSLTLWYSPVIARWIAERDGRPVEPDGSAIRTMPLADREWAIRHVLQYGPDARILAPDDLAHEVVDRLTRMANSLVTLG